MFSHYSCHMKKLHREHRGDSTHTHTHTKTIKSNKTKTSFISNTKKKLKQHIMRNP